MHLDQGKKHNTGGGRGKGFVPTQPARLLLSQWRGIHPASLFPVLGQLEAHVSQADRHPTEEANDEKEDNRMLMSRTMCVSGLSVNSLEVRKTHLLTFLLALFFFSKVLKSHFWQLAVC